MASRAMVQALARWGFPIEVLCGAMFDLREEIDLSSWLVQRCKDVEEAGGQTWDLDAQGVRPDIPAHFKLIARGVPVTVHRGPTTRPHAPDEAEGREFLRIFEAILARFHPEIVVGYGGSWLALEIFARARAVGINTVSFVHNFNFYSFRAFSNVDHVCVPSRFAADYYRSALGLDSTVLPNLIDFERVLASPRDPRYVTFVNPSYEKGVYAFARIADELGRRRPDIPLLVIEGRGSERTLAGCGLDLRIHGNVNLMGHTPDPRQFWRLTRVCLMPSLWWENQPLVAIEAMINGIPVIGSDRGGIPETLGGSGIVLPLPDRLTPTTRWLPTAEEVAPWVEAIIHLWDDPDAYDAHRARALTEAMRWAPERLEPQYVRFFDEVRSRRPASVPRGGGVDPEVRPGRHGPGGEVSREPHLVAPSHTAEMTSHSYRMLIYRGTENLGDAIQAVAMSRLLGGELLGIYRDEAHQSLDMRATFVINGWLGDRANSLDRNCLFAGIHIGRHFEHHIGWVRNSNYAVGCRDDYTVARLAEEGVQGKLVGCATMTLPRYERSRQGEYSIDCNRGGKVLSQCINGMVLWEDQWKMAVERLELLRTAALIHTNRLHVVLPCLAMGTPVIVHEDDARRVFQPQRLRLLGALGFPFDRPVVMDVTAWADGYKRFLAENLNVEIRPHEPVMPRPIKIS